MASSQIIENHSLMNGKHSISYTPHPLHNSKPLAVNRVGPDILYNILKLAVYESSTPMETVLNISRVCRYWRNTALESPILWRTIDLDNPRSIVNLFVSRSGNVPLIISWKHPTRRYTECSFRPYRRRSLRKVSRERITDLNHVFPRLCSFTFHLRCSELDGIRHVLQNPEVPALQLRRLDVHLLHDELEQYYGLAPLPLTDLVRVDPFYLEELILDGVDLPWIDLPSTSKLTSFTFSYPPDPPTISHLLKFLSFCPLLCDLQLGVYGVEEDKIGITDSDPITRLDFPKLQRLTMSMMDVTSYIYIREFSTRIKTLPSLSGLALRYNNCQDFRSPYYHDGVEDTTTLNVLETIPSKVLCNFAGHQCLRVNVGSKNFAIFSAPNYPGRSDEDYPFRVSGSFPLDHPTSFNGLAPILDMIRAMPRITDLTLVGRAWHLPWVADIPILFPCLDTLRVDMWWYIDITPALNSLPANLKIKRLVVIYAQKISVDGLLDVVLKTEAEILEMKTDFIGEDWIQILETALSERARGVRFVRISTRSFEENEGSDFSDDHLSI